MVGKIFTSQRVKLYGGIDGSGRTLEERQPLIKLFLDTIARIIKKGESCCLFTLLLSGCFFPCWKAKARKGIPSHTSGKGPTAAEKKSHLALVKPIHQLSTIPAIAE